MFTIVVYTVVLLLLYDYDDLLFILCKLKNLLWWIMVELTGEGRACIPVGLTKTWDGLVN